MSRVNQLHFTNNQQLTTSNQLNHQPLRIHLHKLIYILFFAQDDYDVAFV
jgi:hypothetical protein